MKYKNFEEYLQIKHIEEEPTILDDDLPDAFSEWIANLSQEDLINYADEYVQILLKNN